MRKSAQNIVFFWENFGPLHVDRVDSVVKFFPGHEVHGLEFRTSSDVYDWKSESGSFNKVTLFAKGKEPGFLGRSYAMWAAVRKIGKGHYFLCHYNWLEVFVLAWLLRLTGNQVYTMGCSKFDDKPRSSGKEYLKSWFLKPYHGALSSGIRSRDYFRFLGIPERNIYGEYNTASIERFRKISGVWSAPSPNSHSGRQFCCVARFVEKKNHVALIDAYHLYQKTVDNPRELHLCGSGELEENIRNQVAALGLTKLVKFHGFLQTHDIARVLSTSLALLLPSVEEQFGNVVIEAQALGIPVVVSDNCGARDNLVRNGVNGFVVEPNNVSGIAQLLQTLHFDQPLWSRLANCAYENAGKGDVVHFSKGVDNLMGHATGKLNSGAWK